MGTNVKMTLLVNRTTDGLERHPMLVLLQVLASKRLYEQTLELLPTTVYMTPSHTVKPRSPMNLEVISNHPGCD